MASVTGLLSKVRNVSSEVAGMISFTSLLGVTGIALFLWMAGTHWEDKTGMIVSIIFVVLTALQVCVSVVWWRMNRKHEVETQDVVSVQDEESIEMLKGKEMVNSNGNNGGAMANGAEELRHRGDGDHVATA